jgi:hypothetical protein
VTGTAAAKLPPNQTRLGSRPLAGGPTPANTPVPRAPAHPTTAGAAPLPQIAAPDAPVPAGPAAAPSAAPAASGFTGAAIAAAGTSPLASPTSGSTVAEALPAGVDPGAPTRDAPGAGRTAGAGSVAGPHPLELAGLLHELSVRLLSADDLSQALNRLAVFTAGTVPGVMRCSVTLITDGEPLTLAVSGMDGQPLDDLQYAVGQGPGLDSARTRTLVTTQELPSDTRWPELAECARAQGVHSVAAIPLDVQRSSVGSLSLFVRRPHGIDPDLLLTAMAIVSQAEVLLAELVRREALSEGATVDRAIGVIIAQRGCGVRDAYDVLHETALRLGMDRRAVAERLLTAAARNAAHD